MSDQAEPVENTTTVDGWEILGTSEFVTPGPYLEYQQAHRDGMVASTLMDALAAYADDDGVIERFWSPDFYNIHLNNVVVDEDDRSKKKYRLKYDAFSAIVILEYLLRLMNDGLLAHRGNGDSASYRLALPRDKA